MTVYWLTSLAYFLRVYWRLHKYLVLLPGMPHLTNLIPRLVLSIARLVTAYFSASLYPRSLPFARTPS